MHANCYGNSMQVSHLKLIAPEEKDASAFKLSETFEMFLTTALDGNK